MLTRREFLASVPLLPACAQAAIGQSAVEAKRGIRAASAQLQIAPPDYPATEVWAYNGQVPGEELRLSKGEELNVRFENALEEDTTIHWHGLRLPNAMDGVPNLTQPPVPPGGVFDYRFVLPDAGTFWYHPHSNSVEQISRGLAGVLVVEESDAPDVDRDEVIVLDDWRMTPEAAIHASFGNRHDLSHAGRIGNYVTANAQPELKFDATPGERWRLRLVNTATARIFQLRLQGVKAWVMALDGMPLEAPQEADAINLAPAQRADILVDISEAEDAFIASVERDGTYAVVSFRPGGGGRAKRTAPSPLEPNAMPVVVSGQARKVPLVMEGGAMRGLPEGAIWKGRKMDFRKLAEAGQFWAFNGVAGHGEEPFIKADLGETLRIPISNKTAFPHAMHLHGTHFREVLPDDTLGPWRDTLLVMPGQMRDIAFVAENPGDWMFHCHMPSHQMSGMMNWIKVV